MVEMRKMGYKIRKIAEDRQIDQSSVAEALGCSEKQISDLYDGRLFLSFAQIDKLVSLLKTDLEQLQTIDDDEYRNAVVHTTVPFTS